ncbi:putative Testicular acid phosphatase-like protein [Hypsibius exemplaris]|uniref:Testicular acid phosphatase-like protein n=1 Tax=Hypsibius exemplaris TaxID=2072580 RepID=A0A1W0WWB2_HYPEX|nr:putative Testicular acid phosphatase-like protein [Hypsibius exemplaris]
MALVEEGEEEEAPMVASSVRTRNRFERKVSCAEKCKDLFPLLAILLVGAVLIGLIIYNALTPHQVYRDEGATAQNLRAANYDLDDGIEHNPHLPSSENVKLIFVGFRHGNRNPGQFLKNDTSYQQWAWEGPSQLTNIGKRQAYSLGKFLRKRYGRLVPAEFNPSQVKAYSSSAERCQMTLQTCMAGLFPPQGRQEWSNSLHWQAVPYEISDPLLRMYNVKCPQYTTAYQAISDDNSVEAREWLNKDRSLVQYIAQKSGLNASLSDLGDVADNVGNMKMMGVPLPRWVTEPTLDGYPPKDMYKDIMSFAEAHQILCADDPECARMMAGMWLDQIITKLIDKSNKKLQDRVANFYGAHTETVLSLIRLIKAKDVKETPTSAGIVLEYTDVPEPAVRVIFHEPHHDNPDVRLAEVKELEYCEGLEWCPLNEFIRNKIYIQYRFRETMMPSYTWIVLLAFSCMVGVTVSTYDQEDYGGPESPGGSGDLITHQKVPALGDAVILPDEAPIYHWVDRSLNATQIAEDMALHNDSWSMTFAEDDRDASEGDTMSSTWLSQDSSPSKSISNSNEAGQPIPSNATETDRPVNVTQIAKSMQPHSDSWNRTFAEKDVEKDVRAELIKTSTKPSNNNITDADQFIHPNADEINKSELTAIRKLLESMLHIAQVQEDREVQRMKDSDAFMKTFFPCIMILPALVMGLFFLVTLILRLKWGPKIKTAAVKAVKRMCRFRARELAPTATPSV